MLAKAVKFANCADGVNMSCEHGLGLLFTSCLPLMVWHRTHTNASRVQTKSGLGNK